MITLIRGWMFGGLGTGVGAAPGGVAAGGGGGPGFQGLGTGGGAGAGAGAGAGGAGTGSGGGSPSAGCGSGVSSTEVVASGTAIEAAPRPAGEVTELGAVGEPCPPQDPVINTARKRNMRKAIDLADVNISGS